MQARLPQPKAVHTRVDIANADLVDNQVGRAVVAQDDHEHGRIGNGQCVRRAQELQHATARTLVGGQHDQRVAQLDGAALNVMEKLDQDWYLNDARARELLAAINRQRFPTRQILNVKSNHAMMAGYALLEWRTQFVQYLRACRMACR